MFILSAVIEACAAATNAQPINPAADEPSQDQPTDSTPEPGKTDESVFDILYIEFSEIHLDFSIINIFFKMHL